ncbi:MAG: hypothetical protein LBT10_04035 [Methanobrevibacter sp.]|jgi:hypothetical protein|nr:hypothetical protein [Methanobrevibacter sp.]
MLFKNWRTITNLEGIFKEETEEFTIESFLCPHGSCPNRSFKLTDKQTGESLCYITDCSSYKLLEKHLPNKKMLDNLTYYLCEFNYSEDLFDLGLEFIYGNPKFQKYDIIQGALRHSSKEDAQAFIDRHVGKDTKKVEELHQSERFYDLTIRDPRESKDVLQDYDFSNEIWKELEMFTQSRNRFYVVSNLGRIGSFSVKSRQIFQKKDTVTFRILKPMIVRNYLVTSLGCHYTRKFIHRLVAFKFCNIKKLTWEEFNKPRHKNTSNKIWDTNHKNRNGFDNRADNLEILHYNEHKKISILQKKEDSKGYYEVNNKYIAGIKIDGKSKYLGTFKTKEEAKIAYNNAWKKRGL